MNLFCPYLRVQNLSIPSPAASARQQLLSLPHSQGHGPQHYTLLPCKKPSKVFLRARFRILRPAEVLSLLQHRAVRYSGVVAGGWWGSALLTQRPPVGSSSDPSYLAFVYLLLRSRDISNLERYGKPCSPSCLPPPTHLRRALHSLVAKVLCDCVCADIPVLTDMSGKEPPVKLKCNRERLPCKIPYVFLKIRL